MGMLMAMTLLKQKEEAERLAKSAEVKEEIPFNEPEEPVQQVKEVPKTATRGRRKGTK